MSGLVRLVAALAVLAAVAQWAGPQWLAAAVAQALASENAGYRPAVAITAVPFWMLLYGHFQTVVVDAAPLVVDQFRVRRALLVWQDGTVSVPALLEHRLVVQSPGHITVRLTVSDQDLSRFLQANAPLKNPEVHIEPGGVNLAATVALKGMVVPLDLTGQLRLAPDGEAVWFLPAQVDGIPLPVPTALTVFDLHRLHPWVPMRLAQLTLGPGQLELTAVSTAG
ncbi:MAG: DUF2993 domain-containing protein [Firmicutes bacterium]|nr:LmeA family phospholipid-binding protein [Alicyclobacillaceae bacterium]MCL6497718.1 DUF2993 domain-containing protein [Bacillota bacterium]